MGGEPAMDRMSILVLGIELARVLMISSWSSTRTSRLVLTECTGAIACVDSPSMSMEKAMLTVAGQYFRQGMGGMILASWDVVTLKWMKHNVKRSSVINYTKLYQSNVTSIDIELIQEKGL